MTYTKEDVIFTKNDIIRSGIKEGDIVYYDENPVTCIYRAKHDINPLKLIEIGDKDYPFHVNEGWFGCVIRRKTPTIKYIPFDLSNEEDQRYLLGKTIKSNYDESEYPLDEVETFFAIQTITAFGIGFIDDEGNTEWFTPLYGDLVDSEKLLKDYVFFDTGKPVGKEVEE